MDKQFILMSEKAVEIQKRWSLDKLTTHDFIHRISDPKRKGFDIVIWLPTQAQLQGMVYREDAQHLLLDFYNSVGALFDEREKYWLQFTSMEALWLAFVMHELYKKKWTGKEWTKIEIIKRPSPPGCPDCGAVLKGMLGCSNCGCNAC